MLNSIIDTYEVYASLLKWEECSDPYGVTHTKYNDCIIHRFYVNSSTTTVFHCISASKPIMNKHSSMSMEHLTCRKCRKDNDTCYIFYDLAYLLMCVDYGVA